MTTTTPTRRRFAQRNWPRAVVCRSRRSGRQRQAGVTDRRERGGDGESAPVGGRHRHRICWCTCFAGARRDAAAAVRSLTVVVRELTVVPGRGTLLLGGVTGFVRGVPVPGGEPLTGGARTGGECSWGLRLLGGSRRRRSVSFSNLLVSGVPRAVAPSYDPGHPRSRGNVRRTGRSVSMPPESPAPATHGAPSTPTRRTPWWPVPHAVCRRACTSSKPAGVDDAGQDCRPWVTQHREGPIARPDAFPRERSAAHAR